MILSYPEHTRICLKVKYLGRIEYDFKKSLVTGPWDHMVSVSAKKVFSPRLNPACGFRIPRPFSPRVKSAESGRGGVGGGLGSPLAGI